MQLTGSSLGDPRGSARRALLGTGVAALVAVAGAGAATSFSVPADSSAAGSFDCGKGKVATAGGFRGPADAVWRILSDQPQGRRWKVKLHNYRDVARAAKLRALCGKGARFVARSRSVTVSLGASEGTTKSVKVRCPAGTSVAGGGFPPARGWQGYAPLESRPAGKRAWLVRAYAYLAPAPGDIVFRARAVCDRTDARYVVRSRSSGQEGRAARARRGDLVSFDLRPHCRKGEVFTGGGFGTEDVNARFTTLGPFHGDWRVAGTKTPLIPITGYAVCRG